MAVVAWRLEKRWRSNPNALPEKRDVGTRNWQGVELGLRDLELGTFGHTRTRDDAAIHGVLLLR